MKTRSRNLVLTCVGLTLGFLATLTGIYMSSAIENTVTVFSIVVVVWGALLLGVFS